MKSQQNRIELVTRPAGLDHDDDDEEGSLLLGQGGVSHDGVIEGAEVRHFSYKHIKYVWDSRAETFVRLRGLEVGQPLARFHAFLSQGLTQRQQESGRMLYGGNSIVVEVKSWFKLLFEEVLNPFYVFQIGSMALWASDEYYNYATCIFVISAISIAISLWETRRQSQNLSDMVKSSNCLRVSLIRAGRSLPGTIILMLFPLFVISINSGFFLTSAAEKN